MSITILSEKETDELVNIPGPDKKAIDISALCNQQKLAGDRAHVFYYKEEEGRKKMFGLIYGNNTQLFFLSKITKTIPSSTLRDLQFYAVMFGLETKALCSIIIENTPSSW